MKQRSHSAAPWTIDYTSDKRKWGYVRCALNSSSGTQGKMAVARVTHSGLNFAEAMSNLHLIGAAPDLLLACEKVLSLLSKYQDDTEALRLKFELLNTIKKAKGEYT